MDELPQGNNLALEITADIQTHPEFYRVAGEWLDRRFGFDQCFGRLVSDLREDRRTCLGWQVRWAQQLRSSRTTRDERRQILLGKHGRILCAIRYYLDNLPDWIFGLQEAYRICLITSILLDPDADDKKKITPPPTDFLCEWPWSDEDGFCFEEHAKADRKDLLFRPRQYVWMMMDNQ
ncbi:unnamed protein product, partial [marine sediment metagenome]